MSSFHQCLFIFITWDWKYVFDWDVPLLVFVCSSLFCCLTVSLDSLWRTGAHVCSSLSTKSALEGWCSTVVVVLSLFVFSFSLKLSSKRKNWNQGDGCFIACNGNIIVYIIGLDIKLCLLHVFILTLLFQKSRYVDPGVTVCLVLNSCSLDILTYYLLYSWLISSN